MQYSVIRYEILKEFGVEISIEEKKEEKGDKIHQQILLFAGGGPQHWFSALSVTAKKEIIISVLYGIGMIELKKKKIVMIPRTKKFLFWDLTAMALCDIMQ